MVGKEKKKTVYPIIISFLIFVLSIVLVYVYGSSLQNYETELTLPRNSSIYLHPSFSPDDMTITQLTNNIKIFQTQSQPLHQVPVHTSTFQTKFEFNPSTGLTKLCGTIQGAMRIVFDQLECKCIHGLCPELQELKVKLRTLTEKFNQAYEAHEQKIDFQVRRSQLIGDSEFETSPAFLELADVILDIEPQKNISEYRQQCVLSLNYTIISRQYESVGEIHELKADITESKPFKIPKGAVIEAMPTQADFVLIQIKTGSPQKATIDGMGQLSSIILLGVIQFIYSIVNYLYCDLDKVELFE
ncbi:Transmembrane_domain-containing protein [Hexamita inflata]|uniref:Transmembrane domain-containing protein n=1 Tax=Hexamita inflata TaxID=28002 RepID=A0AA86Q8N4_9EUKA|nr:Transmembrane domain-containing protein [Hexamita inflata]